MDQERKCKNDHLRIHRDGPHGNMLVRKFVETGAIKAKDILASNRTPEKTERLAKATGIRPVSNRLVAELSDLIFLCVRPLEVRDVLLELGICLPQRSCWSLWLEMCPCQLCRANASPGLPALYPAWHPRDCKA